MPRAHRPFGWPVLALLATASLAPGQYPPGQYPPGQYPPGKYPPGQYPPNTYPVPGPGGVPIGVQVPEIKLPKRKSKDERDSGSTQEAVRTTVVSAEGSLRRLGEKDLLLQAARGHLLRFRLLVKTQFRNKAGDSIRDSLLHPGDQLSVDVSPDDEETALRVVLLRAGTASERTESERPFDEASARGPDMPDFGKPHAIGTLEPAPAEAAPDAAAVPAAPEAPPGTDEQILADARAAAALFTTSLPNYLAQQVMTRYFSAHGADHWQQIDVITAELAYTGGKEQYRNLRVDGISSDQSLESAGWSTGEFGSTLEDVLSPATKATFRRRGEERIGGRPAFVFDLSVAQANSHWILVAPDQHRYSPAYEGALWIDQQTRRVLRIEHQASSMPPDFPFSSAQSILNYDYVKVDGLPYLLPSKAENLGCMSGSGSCTRNVIEFHDYRKFTADSKVQF